MHLNVPQCEDYGDDGNKLLTYKFTGLKMLSNYTLISA